MWPCTGYLFPASDHDSINITDCGVFCYVQINKPNNFNQNLAFIKMFDEVIRQKRQEDMELCRLLATDQAFKSAMQKTLKKMVD